MSTLSRVTFCQLSIGALFNFLAPSVPELFVPKAAFYQVSTCAVKILEIELATVSDPPWHAEHAPANRFALRRLVFP